MSSSASPLEVLWTLASALAAVLHLWLTVQAFLDWRATLRAEHAGRLRRWREVSAGWYLVGQLCLFVPRLLDLGVGLLAMALPNQPTEELRDATAMAQWALIAAEWIGALGAVAFWLARQALRNLAEEHNAEHTQREERVMAESTTPTKRLAETIRQEADAQQERHIAGNSGRLQDVHPAHPDFQRGFIEGLRSAADLLDEPRGT